MLVAIIKDKAGKIDDRGNYRPIASANILSKVLEETTLNRMELYVLTSDSQFGFKSRHGADVYFCFHLYNRHNSTIFECVIEASKVFDCVNHKKLFHKLREQRGSQISS